VVAVLILLATVKPKLRDAGFAVSMAILGVGMGLIVSQLGTVMRSSARRLRGIDFVSADQVQAAAEKAGLDQATTAAIMDDYAKAQLGSLKVGPLTAALLALMPTRALPHDPPTGRRKQEEPALSPSSA